MGGGYYEYDASDTVHTAPARSAVLQATAASGFSAQAEEVMGQQDLHSECDPLNRTVISRHKSPVIVAIDVTGSMGNWTKIIYDKLPMFYGQIMMQGYLEDPAICFAAVGDANSDEAPLQVGEFCQGANLDDWIAKLWLEGGGGGQNHETYELAAHFFNEKVIFDGACDKPFLFFTGDEGLYPMVLGEHVMAFIDDSNYDVENMATEDVFRLLRRKYHVFLLHKPFFDAELDMVLKGKWEAVIGGEHILELKDPKSVIDVMLGAIAMVSGTRTMESYITDLEGRGQTEERKLEVRRALAGLTGERAPSIAKPAAAASPAPATTSNADEMARMKAELDAAKKELEMLRMKQELEAARAEIARMKAGQ